MGAASHFNYERDTLAPWEAVTPRVSDFGLAVSDGGHDVSETSLACPRGTPSYMAPEQAAASRAEIGAASDIHALGAILYELLTGRPPFQGTSTLETLDQVRGQNPVPPRRLNPKIPRDLETIALKCLEKNPSRRYASAEALADDLNRWLEGRPIKARPVSPIEHAWRWCRRRPAVTALAAALMMTFSVGFLTIVLLWRRAEARPQTRRTGVESGRTRTQPCRTRAEPRRDGAAPRRSRLQDRPCGPRLPRRPGNEGPRTGNEGPPDEGVTRPGLHYVPSVCANPPP